MFYWTHQILVYLCYYLAKKFWTGIISSVCMCLCVCLCVFIRFISKSSWPILMKLGRMMYNDKVQVPFEDELNRFIRTEVTENPYLYFFLLRPFDYIFLMLLPLVYHWRGKMQLASWKKKHFRLKKWGGPGMCSTEHTKF